MKLVLVVVVVWLLFAMLVGRWLRQQGKRDDQW